MYDGILFQTPKFRGYSESDTNEYRFCIVYGWLIKDPEVKMYNSKKTSFTIKYYTKSFLNIVIWGESVPSYMTETTLKKGDSVFCIGTIVSKTSPKDPQKVWHSMNCNMILPLKHVDFLNDLYLSPRIRQIIDSENEDVMESLKDMSEEEYHLDDDDDYEVNI